jgi:hypothetical protein
MKKLIAVATLPAVLALAACGGTETPAEEEAPAAAVADDDNDAAEPAPAPIAEEEPHDESVPHSH